jgi:hypothetical protein
LVLVVAAVQAATKHSDRLGGMVPLAVLAVADQRILLTAQSAVQAYLGRASQEATAYSMAPLRTLQRVAVEVHQRLAVTEHSKLAVLVEREFLTPFRLDQHRPTVAAAAAVAQISAQAAQAAAARRCMV